MGTLRSFGNMLNIKSVAKKPLTDLPQPRQPAALKSPWMKLMALGGKKNG